MRTVPVVRHDLNDPNCAPVTQQEVEEAYLAINQAAQEADDDEMRSQFVWQAKARFKMFKKALREPYRAIYKAAVWSTGRNIKDYSWSGKVIFVHTLCWVQDGCQPYVSKVYENPTGADAYFCFAEAIEVTGDRHHVFLEYLEAVWQENGVAVVRFNAGS